MDVVLICDLSRRSEVFKWLLRHYDMHSVCKSLRKVAFCNICIFALKIQIFDELAIKQFDFIFCLKWDIFLDFHPWCSSWFLVQFVVCWFVFRQQRRNLQRKIKTAKPSISLAIIIRFKGHSKIFFQTFWDHLAKENFEKFIKN